MLTIIVGSHIDKRLAKQNELILNFKKKDTRVVEITDANYNLESLKESAGSSGLFGDKTAYIVKGIDERKEEIENFFEHVSLFVDSQTEYVLSVSKLTAPFLKKAEKFGAKIISSGDEVKEKKYDEFNIFNLTDAFSSRNRSQTWALYLSALSSGIDSRELAGKFFWATKTMMLAKNSKNAKESGLHEFVYTKSKKNASNFKEGELENISYEITKLFHDSMVEGFPLEVALESFILKSLAK